MEAGTDSLAWPTSAKRARTSYGYSGNGCARCKQQRVRCDERRPGCERCLLAGITCPGFTSRLRWSTKHENPRLRRRELQRQETIRQTSRRDSATAADTRTTAAMAQDGSVPSSAQETAWTSLFAQCFPLSQESRDLLADLNQQQKKKQASPAASDLFGDDLLAEEVSQIAPTGAEAPTATAAIPAVHDLAYDDVMSEEEADTEEEEEIPQSPASSSSEDMPLPRPMTESRRRPAPAASTAVTTSSCRYLPAPPAAIRDVSSGLVGFYFKETARVFSCFDSRMNPFRTAVVRVWSSSRLIYCTLQSMAAACLVDDFPHMGPVGRRLRREAIQQLSAPTTLDLHALLAMLMLGASASWHDPHDLGLPFFSFLVRRLAAAPPAVIFGSEAAGDGVAAEDGAMPDSSIDQRNYRFFYESTLYWEMLLAFVADSSSGSDNSKSSSSSSSSRNSRNSRTTTLEASHPMTLAAFPSTVSADTTVQPPLARLQHPQHRGHPHGPAVPPQRVPHPWTGFAADTQRAVQQVGRLVRQQRKAAYTHVFPSTAHIRQLQRAMAAARRLEVRLMGIAHPDEDAVADTGDRETPVWHLLSLAEIIRAVGLVQLYHVFPDLLRARLERERKGRDAPDDEGSRWLTAYAVRTLDMMRSIPLESGTRDFQPFLLVALSSELRASPTGHANDDVDLQAVEVRRARGFIRSRLLSFVHVLPPKPMRVCLQIVEETWAQMDRQKTDDDEPGVYWMDVMIENGWETTMA